MGLETYFKIFAVDNTGKHKYAKEQVEAIWNEERKHELTYPAANVEGTAPISAMPPFLRVREEPDADSKKYNYLPEQKNDPFPIWIDTTTGNEAYEIMDVNFLSDFDKLYEHYNLQVASECCEVPANDIEDMLTVLNYILKGKYDEDIEETVFRSNEFFKVFEDQFFNFGMRFRNRKKENKVQTLKIIVEDKRADVKRMDSEEDEEDDWDLQEERKASEKEERCQIERLKDVLTAFLYMREPDYVKNPRIIYKLGYFLSY